MLLACGRQSRQLLEQRLRLLQIERIEAFGEPAIDGRKKIAGLIPFALIAVEPRHAYRRAHSPGLCLLLTGNGESTFEVPSAFQLQLPLRCGPSEVLNLHPTVGPARAMEQT
jgi:hypothetical protein